MVKQGEAGLFSIVYIYYIYAFVSLFYINSMSDVVLSLSAASLQTFDTCVQF